MTATKPARKPNRDKSTIQAERERIQREREQRAADRAARGLKKPGPRPSQPAPARPREGLQSLSAAGLADVFRIAGLLAE